MTEPIVRIAEAIVHLEALRAAREQLAEQIRALLP